MSKATIDKLLSQVAELKQITEAKSELLAAASFERDELKSQLAEVQNNCAGVSPCAKFCEALATKKMFDNFREENDALKVSCRNKDFAISELNSELDAVKAQVEKVRKIADQTATSYGQLIKQFRAIYGVIYSSQAQCLAERDAEVVIKFGEKIISHFEGCNYNLTRQTLASYIYDQFRQQARK